MKILIVDDESINRILLVNLLENAGYTDCIEAANGVEAIDKYKREQPDLVLLDVVMPDMSGFDVVKHLRSHATEHYLPILFITALDDKESLVKCLDVGGNDFATKPFDKHILIAKIRAHLQIRALSLRIEQQNKALLLFNQRVAREHAIVEHIFSNAIVNDPKVLSYFDYCIKPAQSFNGDVFLCEASPSGGIYFVVGDFTGHGLASAVGALPVTRAFQELSQQGVSVSELAKELNHILLKFLPHDMFMAAVVGEIDASGTRVTLWQGGMPAVICNTSQANKESAFIGGARFEEVGMPGGLRQIPARHMALGILENEEFDTQCDTISLSRGTQLIVVSDGLIEVVNGTNHMLMEEGLVDIIHSMKRDNQTVTAEGLYQKVRNYSVSKTFDDDISAVIFASQPIELVPKDSSGIALPSLHEIALSAEHLKQPDVLQRVLQIAGQCEGIQNVRSILYTVISELFNNALEHGVLLLDSELKSTSEGFHTYYQLREKLLNQLSDASITITIEALPNQHKIRITVKDSGCGFSWDNFKSVNDDESYGRGLALVQAMCEQMWFEDKGSKVICSVDTKGTP